MINNYQERKSMNVSFESVPGMYSMGLPVGNGQIGAMIWRNDLNHLCISLDHCDAWDLRHSHTHKYEKFSYGKLRKLMDAGNEDDIKDAVKENVISTSEPPTKINLGELVLPIECGEDQDFSLDLAKACFQTGFSNCRCEIFAAWQSNVLAVKFSQLRENMKLKYIPFYAAGKRFSGLGHPKIELLSRNELQIALQHVLPDRWFAIAWNEDGNEIFISLAFARNRNEATTQALATHPHSMRQSFETLFEEHEKSWLEFWRKSSVSLPEEELERFWFYGLYIMRASTRQGHTPPGLRGLWTSATLPFRGDYHNNVNVQEYFWSAYTANHLELLDCWVDDTFKYLSKIKEITKKIFGTRGSFYLCAHVAEYTPISDSGVWSKINCAWSCTGWLMQLVWLRWRYSMDVQWLKDIGHPLIKAAFEFYSENLEMEPDGKYHIPLSESPEFGEDTAAGWCKDPNADIAVIRKCCDWIIEAEKVLKLNEYSDRAREIHEKLVYYHLLEFPSDVYYVKNKAGEGAYTLGLWKDKLLDHSHRHPSHLMAIHPIMDITIDDGEIANKIIEMSLMHYMQLGQYCWCGHTYAQMINMAAVVGKGQLAYCFLRNCRDYMMLPNKLLAHFEFTGGRSHFSKKSYGELDDSMAFSMNVTTSITNGISDMLLQSWGDKIRIFPAVPVEWKDLSFENLRTEGAFEISAVMKSSKVCMVKIKATVDGICRLQSPFGVEKFAIDGKTPQKDGELLMWDMAAGQEVRLFTTQAAGAGNNNASENG